MSQVITSAIELGAGLRAARQRSALTQETVAHRAGVSRAFVTELERGRRPGAELARVLSVMHAVGLGIQFVEDETEDIDRTLDELLEGPGR